MGYLDRTLNIKQTLLQSPRHLEIIRSTFANNSYGTPVFKKGGGRSVYDLGILPLPEGVIDQLLLKLPRPHSIRILDDNYKRHSTDWQRRMLYEELGAFDAYFELLSGEVEHIGVDHGESIGLNQLSTRASVGDLGAIPYFHLVVLCGDELGFLTEGTGNLQPPLRTVRSTPNGIYLWDEGAVEGHRIVDLEPDDCDIGQINRKGGEDCLGLCRRGRHYFLPENCLDLGY